MGFALIQDFNSSARFDGLPGRGPIARTHKPGNSADLFTEHARRVLASRAAGPGPRLDRGNHVIRPPSGYYGFAVSNENPNAVRAADVRKALSYGLNPVRKAARTPGPVKGKTTARSNARSPVGAAMKLLGRKPAPSPEGDDDDGDFFGWFDQAPPPSPQVGLSGGRKQPEP